jgi:homoserine O-acetyltransferase
VPPKARKTVVVAGEFPMHRGGTLLSPTIAYETWGKLNHTRDNAVLIFTGMSPSAHAASAPRIRRRVVEEIIGPVDRHAPPFQIVELARAAGSRGPASVDPRTATSIGSSSRAVLEDALSAAASRSSSIRQSAAATVGPSMGGMTALAFEILFPGLSEGLVSMSSGPRSLPFSIALRSLQREIIRKDPAWMGGHYPRDAQPLVGMRLARKLGMITYRSAEEWRLRFGRERSASTDTSGDPFGQVFEVETYLEHHAQKFTGQFDANCYLYLSRASDLFDVTEHGSSVDAALSKLRVTRALIIGVKTDFLFPIYQQRELAEALEARDREVEFVELNSLQGHDSFLVDMDNYRPLLEKFFA